METKMMKSFVTAAALLAAVTTGGAAYAQNGAAGGATAGAIGGAVVGGPVGAVVGGAVGAIAGGISDADRPRFREYVVHERVPSYRYDRDVRVGAELPREGVTYYKVPNEYGASRYRYTVVNNRTVLVDPQTHRVVEVIE
jgi:hypothetical protein